MSLLCSRRRQSRIDDVDAATESLAEAAGEDLRGWVAAARRSRAVRLDRGAPGRPTLGHDGLALDQHRRLYGGDAARSSR